MSGEPKPLNPDAPEFIPERNDSGKKHPANPHYRYNCASNFQSLASHLDRLMNTPGNPPNKARVLKWIESCMRARLIVDENRIRKGELLDERHERVLSMLNNLYIYVNDQIREGSSASFEFLENPHRFIVNSEGREVEVSAEGVELVRERRYGGRKSTRKHRKSKRKTHRILPRVEGS
jgi:hypothetical protein